METKTLNEATNRKSDTVLMGQVNFLVSQPYYEADGITIYNADCMDIMPSLVSGTVVTDPPYNIGYHYEGYADNLDVETYQDILRVACRLPSVVIHYSENICALSWTLEEIPTKMVAWVYNSNTAKQWRGIAWWGNKPNFENCGQPYKNPSDKRIAKRISEGQQARLYDWWEVNQVKNVGVEKTEHPCQIPLSLMKRVLQITNAEVIIDPFMGSGTTLVAAKELGRRAIGIEINKKYCDIAIERLRQGVLFSKVSG